MLSSPRFQRSKSLLRDYIPPQVSERWRIVLGPLPSPVSCHLHMPTPGPQSLSWVQPHSFLYNCCSSKKANLSLVERKEQKTLCLVSEKQTRQMLSLMCTGEGFLLPHSNFVSMRWGGQATKGKLWPWDYWGMLGRASLAKLLSFVRRLLSSSFQPTWKRN